MRKNVLKIYIFAFFESSSRLMTTN